MQLILYAHTASMSTIRNVSFCDWQMKHFHMTKLKVFMTAMKAAYFLHGEIHAGYQ